MNRIGTESTVCIRSNYILHIVNIVLSELVIVSLNKVGRSWIALLARPAYHVCVSADRFCKTSVSPYWPYRIFTHVHFFNYCAFAYIDDHVKLLAACVLYDLSHAIYINPANRVNAVGVFKADLLTIKYDQTHNNTMVEKSTKVPL